MDNKRKIEIFDELTEWFAEHDTAAAMSSTTITKEELIAIGLGSIADRREFEA